MDKGGLVVAALVTLSVGIVIIAMVVAGLMIVEVAFR